MENKDLTKILRKLTAYKSNPSLVQELTMDEMMSLVILILSQIKSVEKAVKEGVKPAQKTPQPDKDYLSKNTALALISQEVNKLVGDTDKKTKGKFKELDTSVQAAISRIRNGKDAEITPEHISEAAKIASELIKLPDFTKEAELAIKDNPKALRNALELLEGDDRLSTDAIRNLEERFKEIEILINTNGQRQAGGVSVNKVLDLIAANSTAIDIAYQATAPTDPEDGDLWVDTSEQLEREVRSADIEDIVALTQAEYDALGSYESTTLYYITD